MICAIPIWGYGVHMANPQMEINPLEAVRAERGLTVPALARRAGLTPLEMQSRIDDPTQMTLAEFSAVASELHADPIALLRPILAQAS